MTQRNDAMDLQSDEMADKRVRQAFLTGTEQSGCVRFERREDELGWRDVENERNRNKEGMRCLIWRW